MSRNTAAFSLQGVLAAVLLLSPGVEAEDCNDNGVEDSQELLGSFYRAETIPLGGTSRIGAVGDLNGDGFVDLASCADQRVIVALNDGEGNLRLAGEATGDHTPAAILVVDADGDQDLDVITLGEDSGKVFVFVNDGLAQLAFQGEYSTGFGPGNSNALASGDLDTDGDQDLVATNYDITAPVLFWNDGNAGFSTRTSLVLEIHQQDVDVAFVNDDALPDIVVLAFGFVVFLNEGGGAFTSLPRVRDDPYTAYTLSLGDMNGDGSLDMVTAGSDVRIHPNDGSGGTAPSAAFPIWDVSTTMALGDVEADGDLDVALPHPGNFSNFENKLTISWNDGHGSLGDEQGYLVDRGPGSAFFLDAENDGDLDLMTFDLQGATLLRNDASGNFETARYVSVTERPHSIAAADFDADGALDLVVGEETYWNFTILWNDVAGFQPDSAFITQPWPGFNSNRPGHVEAVDVSGDGMPDIVTGSYVLFNLGGRKFSARFEPFDSFGGFTTFAVELGDMNGDGSPDAVGFSRTKNAIVLALNDGQGFFTKLDELDASRQGFSIALSDLNADGLLDIGAGLGGLVAVYLRLDNGSFASPVEYPTVGEIFQLEAVDLDSDGTLDLAGATEQNLALLWGLGSGDFETPVNLIHEVRRFEAFDEENDGYTDLATVTRNGLTVLVNLGERTLAPGTTLSYGIDNSTLAVGDLNGDGAEDFAVVDFQADDVGLLFAGRPSGADCNGNGRPDDCDAVTGDCDRNGTPDICDLESRSIRLGTPSVYPTQGGNISTVRAADLTGDQIPDLVVAAGVGTASIALLENDGEGRFLFRSGFFLQDIEDLVLADLDGDSAIDLAASTNDSDKYDPQTPQSHSLHIYEGLGGFDFSETGVHPVGRGPVSVVAADLDQDGDVDLATGNYVSFADLQSPDPILKDITLLRNDGGGTFEAAGGLTTGGRTAMLSSQDMDADGHQDLVAATVGFSTAELIVLHNDGSGGFPSNARMPGGPSPGSLIIRDFDLDADLDVVVGNWALGLQLIRNLGSRRFESTAIALPEPLTRTQPVTAADWDGDGDFDLAMGGPTVLENDGRANFSLAQNSAPLTLGRMDAVDVNDDGKPDLIGSIHSGYTVFVALNETPRFLEPDCNANGIPDACDPDADSDGVPDACDLCPGQADRLDEDLDGQPECLSIPLALVASSGTFRPFVRADTNQSGTVDLSDAVATLNYLFLGAGTPRCIRAMDANGDGTVDISDATYTLGFLFVGGSPIAQPYPECGPSLEPDGLSCEFFRGCVTP